MSDKLIGSGTFSLGFGDEIANLAMNRPEVLNAANCDWMDDLHLALDEIASTKGLRALIVSGVGSSFCTGIDLKALAKQEIKIDWFRSWERAMHRLEMLEIITIARLHGYVIGGGLQVALACDLRIASDDARLGLPAVLEALIPGLGTFRLPRFIGLGRAKRLILTGELLSASESLTIGMVDWVAPAAEVEAKTDEIVRQLLVGSTTAQCFSKWLTTSAFEKDADSVLDDYLEYQARTIGSKEHRIAMEQYLMRKSS